MMAFTVTLVPLRVEVGSLDNRDPSIWRVTDGSIVLALVKL